MRKGEDCPFKFPETEGWEEKPGIALREETACEQDDGSGRGPDRGQRSQPTVKVCGSRKAAEWIRKDEAEMAGIV